METFQYPWDTPRPVVTPLNADIVSPKPKPRGRRPAFVTRVAAPAGTTAPDWLYHHLTISGRADMVEKFAAAARGSGVIPWHLDFAAIEEDVFTRAISQPARHRHLTVEGCRILARQFRERVEAHHARAVAMAGGSLVCPFDLHRLLPVPATILQLGPTEPAALAWLAGHWGTTDRLRQATVRLKPGIGRRLPRGHAVIGYGFFTAGETPHAAISRLATDWPALRVRLVPRPPD
jgi:hypothetical protein